jgi:hypothetical protein
MLHPKARQFAADIIQRMGSNGRRAHAPTLPIRPPQASSCT